MVTPRRRARLGALALLGSAGAPLLLTAALAAGPAGPAWADDPTPAPSASASPEPDEPEPTPSRTSGPPKLPTLPAGPSPTPGPDDTEDPDVEETDEGEPSPTATRRRRTARPTAAPTRNDAPERSVTVPAAPVDSFDVGGLDGAAAEEASASPSAVVVARRRSAVDQLEGAVGLVVLGALVLGAAGGAGLWLTREGA